MGDGRLHVLEIGRVAPTPASVSAPLMAVQTRHPSCSGASIAPVTTPPAAARNVVRSLRAAQRNRAAPSHGARPASTWCAGLAPRKRTRLAPRRRTACGLSQQCRRPYQSVRGSARANRHSALRCCLRGRAEPTGQKVPGWDVRASNGPAREALRVRIGSTPRIDASTSSIGWNIGRSAGK